MGKIHHLLDTVKWNYIYRGCIRKYGVNKQLTILGEECTELAKEIFKIKRYQENTGSINLKQDNHELYVKFVEEFVDVYIMLKQLEIYIDKIVASQIIYDKYKRAEKRLNKDV